MDQFVLDQGQDRASDGLVDLLDVDEVARRWVGLAGADDIELVVGAEPAHRGLAGVAVGSGGERSRVPAT